MSDEMKLLIALCDALRFQVERIVEVTKGTEERTINHIPFLGERAFPDWEEYEFIGDGKYIEVKRNVRFILTKQT